MDRKYSVPLEETLRLVEEAKAELDELNQQLSFFEALVDARLGSLLDQLSELNTETTALDAQLRHIREQHLYGKKLMEYIEGAPQPTPAVNLSDLPPLGFTNREVIHAKQSSSSPVEQVIPDIKVVYRKLARRYHPDLANNEADRAVLNTQMVEINRAYNAGDIKTLMRIAGIGLPYGVNLPELSDMPQKRRSETLSDQEQAERKLKAIRQQILQMSNMPIIKLSLEVKLAQHHGRNLLREMAADLRYKVERKLAERDYLKAQIKIHAGDIEK